MDPRAVEELERAAEGPITVDITTVGRTSGRRRRIEIWMVKVDGLYVIGGTPGPRDWYANLLSNPNLTVHTLSGLDLPATAVPVTDLDHRRRIYEHPATAWYRSQVTVDELVMFGPTVAVCFDGSG